MALCLLRFSLSLGYCMIAATAEQLNVMGGLRGLCLTYAVNLDNYEEKQTPTVRSKPQILRSPSIC